MSNNLKLEIVQIQSPLYTEITRIREEAFRIPQGLRFTPQELETNEKGTHMVYVRDEQVVATGNLIEDVNQKGRGVVRQVVVPPALQGEGLGYKIMVALHEEARKQGFTDTILSARLTALPFYEKLGYKAVGEEFNIHSVPHVYMTLSL